MRHYQFPRCQSPRRTSLLLAAAIAVGFFWQPVVWSQGKSPSPPPSGGRDSLPSQEYYFAYMPYFQGEFVDALKAFTKAADSGLKGANGTWVDSVPLWVMVGECHYRLGNYDDAMAAYRAAIAKYLEFSDFMIRVDWKNPTEIRNKQFRLPITPVRVGKLAQYNLAEQVLMGKVIDGGKVVIDTRRYQSVQVLEIVRTLAIGVRRYGELLGPRAKHDDLLKSLIQVLDKRPTKPGHYSESYVDVLLGVANRAAGQEGSAAGALRRGLLAKGEFEHPLTPIALLELGHLALNNPDKNAADKYKEAGEYFERAAHAALPFYDDKTPGWAGVSDLVEEAFRYGMIAHRLANHQKPFSLAEPMAAWAGAAQRRPTRMLHLQASLLLDLAESYAGLRHPGGDPRSTAVADAWLTKAQKLIFVDNRGEMSASRIGARCRHLEALIRFQQGQIAQGSVAIVRALEYQKRGSLWLYHQRLVDAWGIQPPAVDVTQRNIIELYQRVLREPESLDWQLQPLEALTVAAHPNYLAAERWFRKTLETADRAGGLPALEIADMIRARRFAAAQEIGGRLVTLRWLLEAPREQLSDDAARQRDSLLAQYKEYALAAKSVRQLREELRRVPVVIDDKADRAAADDQKNKLAEIGRWSELQEVLLRQMAVDRVHAPPVFPPRRSAKSVQESLTKGQKALIFFATTPTAESPSRLFTFALTNKKDVYPRWEVGTPQMLVGSMQKLLREMGNYNRDREIPLAQLKKSDWQTPAADLLKGLFTAAPSSGTPEAIGDEIQELVIVPDSFLWYLPFEALPVPKVAGKPDKTVPLIHKYRVRYAPTMSLVVPDKLGHKSGGNLAVVAGKMLPGMGEDKRTRAALEDLQRVVPSTVALPSVPYTATSVHSMLYDRLLVLDDIDTTPGPFLWRPILGRTTPGEKLSAPLESWMQLPWGGPDQVILPGFHTPAENGLADRLSAPGADVFLSTLGVMSTGSRTVLLSRWRTGGKTSFDLTREFAQELPRLSAAQAWQRSVLLCTESPLAPDQEPRVNFGSGAPGGEVMTAGHPFFWSGYLLVDQGVQPIIALPEAKALEGKAALGAAAAR